MSRREWRFKKKMMKGRGGLIPEGLYRARDGVFLGVCKGLARYFDFSVGWLRFLVIVAFLLTGIWPVGVAYLVAGLVMKKEPVLPLRDDMEAEFYDSYTSDRRRALNRLKNSFDNLDRRIRRMEDVVTSREYDWDSRASY